MFIPSCCSTVYRYQGADIPEEYKLFDVEKLDIEMLYTVLSSVRPNFKNIHLNHKSLKKQYTVRKKPALELCNSYFNTQYSKGKIYEESFAKSYSRACT